MEKTARDIWAGLVEFANAEQLNDKVLRTLAETVRNAMPPSAWQIGHNEEGEWRGVDEWQGHIYQFLKGKDVVFEYGNGDKETAFERLATDALTLHPKIRVLLRYLCEAPKFDVQNPLVKEACDFLWSHETHVSFMKVPPQEIESATESRTSFERKEGRARLYPYMNVRRYRCMVDPVCEFINGQLDDYYAGKSTHMVPVVICKREGCEKVVMPQRIGRKEFCDGCKDRHHNAKRRTLQTSRKWLYRLLADGRNDVALLRTKLKRPNTKMRLELLKKEKELASLVAKVEGFPSKH